MPHNWFAVITAQVLMAKDISSTQKLLLALVANLSNERKYCYASNGYLAEKLNISSITVSQAISDLEKKGYLGRIILFKAGSKEVEYRFLQVIERAGETPSIELDIPLPLNSINPPLENNNPPPLENLKDNNKVFNNKDNRETPKSNSIKLSVQERKDKFYKTIKNFFSLNKDKYPAQLCDEFFKHWTETDPNCKKMRFEDQKFFEIGKRLSYWMRNENPVKLSKMWEDHKKQQQVKQSELL